MSQNTLGPSRLIFLGPCRSKSLVPRHGALQAAATRSRIDNPVGGPARFKLKGGTRCATARVTVFSQTNGTDGAPRLRSYPIPLDLMRMITIFCTSDRPSIPISLSKSFKADLFPIWCGLARVAEWDPYKLHDIAHIFLVWMYTMQILHIISQRQVRN